MKRFLYLCLMLAIGSASAHTLTELQQKLETVQTVEAEFVQTKHLQVFQNEIVLKGKMGLRREGADLAWHVTSPIRYSVCFRGAVMTQWDETSQKTTTFDTASNPLLKALLDQMRGWFSGNLSEMQREYDLTLREAPKTRRPVLTCIPKGEISNFMKEIEIRFAEETGYIDSVKLVEASGDWSEIQFLNTKLNQPLSDQLFHHP